MASFGGLLGLPGVTFWGLWRSFWLLWGLRGPLGVPGVTWDVPGRLGGDFHDFPGNSGRSFGSILGLFLMSFLFVFGFCFLIDF